MPSAPSVHEFPAYPASWYLFCRSSELKGRPVSKAMLGRTIVAFRTAHGELSVLDGRCAHLGADLGCGSIAGDRLQCPYHGWQYAADGHCVKAGDGGDVPDFARQVRYPAVERHGFVFFYYGGQPAFELPFFFGRRPEELIAGRSFRFVGECSWFMLAGNGFDGQHFQSIHDRTLTAPAVIDGPTPYCRQMRYEARVTGTSIFDRLIRLFVGDEVRISITSWAGPFIVVTGKFRRATSYILISTQPLDAHRTLAEVIVFADRSRWWLVRKLLQPLSLCLRRTFTQGFMADDHRRLAGIRYSPHTLIEADRDMIEFFDWLASLHKRPAPIEQSTAPRDGQHASSRGSLFCQPTGSRR